MMNAPTEKLYYKDSHCKTFSATVLECIPTKDGFLVTLDKTAFFPEGGGQPADCGTLNSIEVLDVQEEGEFVIHRIAEPLYADTKVTGCINWESRFSLMQHHSGEHIVSGLIHKHYKYDNVGFHMGNDAVTMDFNGILTENDLRKMELLANEVVVKNVPILEFYPSKEERKTLPYRSKKELSGLIRIIGIPCEADTIYPLSENTDYYDLCACCAPHTKRTGEIGMIKLISAMKYKSGTRVSMLCGFRALEDYNKKEQATVKISNLLSSKIYETPEAVRKLREESASCKGTIINLQHQLFTYKAKEIPIGTKNICLFEENLDGTQLRHYCNAVLERCIDTCWVFSNKKEGEYQYIIASKTIDVINLGKSLNARFSGKGGGTKEMIQGSLKGKMEEILVCYEEIIHAAAPDHHLHILS